MASLPDDYDDGADEEHSGPLLPPEDRLWRHPSEVAAGLGLDPVAVRSRWISSQPSKASAWTAGFVGALLATGLVVVGTHLASVLRTPPSNGRSTNASTLTTVVEQSIATPALGRPLLSAIDSVGRSIAVVDAANANGVSDGRCLGIVVGSNGTVLTAAVAVAKAASVLIYLPGHSVASVGDVVAVDEESGLAIVQVHGAKDLPVARFSTSTVAAPAFALAVTTPGSGNEAPAVDLGSVNEVGVRASTALGEVVDADLTSLQAATSPPGSPLLDTDGNVEAIVIGNENGDAIVSPGWIADPVAAELMTDGAVEHGWIGISGLDESPGSKGTSGVQVVSVVAKSAAAKAGIRPGDVIVAIDGHAISSMNDLQGRLYVLGAGTKVSVTYVQGSARHRTELVLSATKN